MQSIYLPESLAMLGKTQTAKNSLVLFLIGIGVLGLSLTAFIVLYHFYIGSFSGDPDLVDVIPGLFPINACVFIFGCSFTATNIPCKCKRTRELSLEMNYIVDVARLVHVYNDRTEDLRHALNTWKEGSFERIAAIETHEHALFWYIEVRKHAYHASTLFDDCTRRRRTMTTQERSSLAGSYVDLQLLLRDFGVPLRP